MYIQFLVWWPQLICVCIFTVLPSLLPLTPLPSLVVGLAARSVFTWLHRFSDSTTSLHYGNGYQVRDLTWLVYGHQQLWIHMRSEGKRWTGSGADGDRASRGWIETLAQVVIGPYSDGEKRTQWKHKHLAPLLFIGFVIWKSLGYNSGCYFTTLGTGKLGSYKMSGLLLLCYTLLKALSQYTVRTLT
jgi:hypothetical protein